MQHPDQKMDGMPCEGESTKLTVTEHALNRCKLT